MGKSHWTLRNDILGAWAMTVVLFAVLAVAFGPIVLPYLVMQAVLGFSLLEVVNYLEHYGLLRQKREDGRYRALPARAQLEQQQRRLQRAALPPAAPQRPPRQPDPPLPGLRHVKEAPQLPTGYAGMIVLAWFPPLWRRVMDPRLIEHYEGDVSSPTSSRAARDGSSPATGRGRGGS